MQIAQILRDHPNNNFYSRVLADGKVSDAEYAEAKDLFTQCMAALGVKVEFPDDPQQGGYTTFPDEDHPQADDIAAKIQCSPDTIDSIQYIYQGMHANPQGLDWATTVRQCLQEHGLNDFTELSDAQLEQEWNANMLKASTPAGALCLMDPTGQVGMTEDGAWMAQQGSQSQMTVTVGPTADPSSGG